MTFKSLKPLHRAPLLHVSVQESLRAYINENGLGAGAPMPPEGELASQLGVSRNSLREGIKALESVRCSGVAARGGRLRQGILVRTIA